MTTRAFIEPCPECVDGKGAGKFCRAIYDYATGQLDAQPEDGHTGAKPVTATLQRVALPTAKKTGQQPAGAWQDRWVVIEEDTP